MSDLYLVTGGAGFIGSHLCEAILARGGRVRVLDNLSTGKLDNLRGMSEQIDFVSGDIRCPQTLEQAMAGVQYLFHEAALVSVFDSVERPMDNHEINITGTLNVLEAARKARVKRMVMASSAAVYGNDPAMPKTESMTPQPESPYAIAKITDEYYMGVYYRLYGLETVSLRYFNVYGPRQDPSSVYSGVISKFTDVLKSGGQPTVFGDGLQSRDFVYVGDVVAANMLAMHESGAGRGEVYNVATGRSVTLLDLLETMGSILNMRVEPVYKPARAGDIKNSVASIDAIHKQLGFLPSHDLTSGLGRLLSCREHAV